MDYGSYKTMCDASLRQIRKSENKRQELNHKLQKMYQEKSECEKSIIKTLQSQHEQFTEEKRRRAERNESILRMLERIDYQASTLAAKTERLRALKKQYERHMLSLWNMRQHGLSQPKNLIAPTASYQFASPFAKKYDESSAHQSSHYERGSEFNANQSRLAHFNALPPFANNPSPTLNYPLSSHNQSYFRAMPSMLVDNSIKSSNYRTTGAIIEPQPSYPSHQVRCDDLTQTPQYQQSVGGEKESFYRHNDSAINNDDMTLPTTINSIYSQQPYRAPQISSFNEKLTAQTSHPIYHQRNNQPLENHNYNSENLEMSEAFYGRPLIMPAASTASLVTQLSPPQLRRASTLSAPSSEMLLKNHSDLSSINNPPPPPPSPQLKTTTNVYMSDGETESDGEKCNVTKRNIRRSDSISDDTYCHQKAFVVPEAAVDTLVGKQHEFIDNSRLKLNETNVKQPQEDANTNRNEIRGVWSINDSATARDSTGHEWNEIIDSIDTPSSSSFVIPKIIVETQIDSTEAPTVTTDPTLHHTMEGIHENRERHSPEKLLNHEMKKHSTDNQQNESLSCRPPQASTVNNNLPLEEAGSSIYHYDKQPFSDEQQQNHQKQPQSRVEHELSKFSEIEISSSPQRGDGGAVATRTMTHESEIKTNNSLAEGISDGTEGGGGEGERRETINNINDDKNQGTSPVALNDKINEIYRKIEKIEDKYYGEKEKIIEDFERTKTSSSSLGDGANVEAELMIDSPGTKSDTAQLDSPQIIYEPMAQSPLELQNNESMIRENDGNEWRSDEHQSEHATNWNESESHEIAQPNYNYKERIENENQQNFLQQAAPENVSPSDDYSQQSMEGEGHQQPQSDNQYYAGDAQTNVDAAQYSYEQDRQYQDYAIDQHQQQSEFDYSHPETAQQEPQQEANISDASYHPQSDSNYQQNNYDEAPENPSNYTNESAGVYYDYDQNQQPQQQQSEAPQIMYDYTHQQQASLSSSSHHQSNAGDEAPQYFYENIDDDNKAEMNQEQSNENNYEFVENVNETSGDNGTLYNATAYQAEAFNVVDTSAYESQATDEMTLENANYQTHPEQESNETFHQMNEHEVGYDRDESFPTTTASTSSSDDTKPLETEVQMNVTRDEEVSAPNLPSKRDDVKLVKQLLDSESDDTTNRSNLLKTSIKEEADESDFDFSMG